MPYLMQTLTLTDKKMEVKNGKIDSQMYYRFRISSEHKTLHHKMLFFFATECTEPFQNENRQGKDRGQETVNEGVND